MSAQTDEKKKHKNTTVAKGGGDAKRKKVKPITRKPEPPKPAHARQTYAFDDNNQPVANFWTDFDRVGEDGKPLVVKAWKFSDIVSIEPPDFAYLLQSYLHEKHVSNSRVNGLILVHRYLTRQFLAFFKGIAAKGLTDRIHYHAGGFVRKKVKGTSRWSNHAFGTAIDFNSLYPDNIKPGPGVVRGTEGSLSEIADFCTDFGFFWGGWFSKSSIWDPMHFEVYRYLAEEELAMVCKRYGFPIGSIDKSFGAPFTSNVRPAAPVDPDPLNGGGEP